ELNRDLDPGLARATLHTLDLVRLAIDEHDPAPLALGVAAQALCERIVDDLLAAMFETRPHTLVDRAWPRGVAFLGVDRGVGGHHLSRRRASATATMVAAKSITAARSPRDRDGSPTEARDRWACVERCAFSVDRERLDPLAIRP